MRQNKTENRALDAYLTILDRTKGNKETLTKRRTEQMWLHSRRVGRLLASKLGASWIEG